MKFDNRTINTIFVSVLLLIIFVHSVKPEDKVLQYNHGPSGHPEHSENSIGIMASLQKELESELNLENELKNDMSMNRLSVPDAYDEAYDEDYSGNLLGSENPVKINDSIYGQNNLAHYFKIDHDQEVRQDLTQIHLPPSQYGSPTNKIDDKEYTSPSALTSAFGAYNEFDSYSPFVLV